MTGPLGASLSHIALRVPEPEPLRHFYEDVLGLACQEQLADGGTRLGWGRGQHALELVPGERGLDHFAFEVPDPAALQALAGRLEAVGTGASWTEPAGDHAPSLRFLDPEGHSVEVHGRVDRSGERFADTRLRPRRVQHITLSTCALAEMASFYEEVVGMSVSDRMGELFVWLRSDRDHHSLALVEGDEPGLDHYSYDVASWDDLKVWCDELARRDVRVGWGPGRHGPGNNLFVIFEDAAGFRVELSAEMERFWDDRAEHAPRLWEPRPETVNLWGPTPDWRRVRA